MGVVYEAEQVSLGRHVALKVLPPQMLRDPKQYKRFEREARAAARLHHTNIVPVFGVGEHDGTPYYVMQFIQGQGLDAVLDELKRLRARRPRRRVVGVARWTARRSASPGLPRQTAAPWRPTWPARSGPASSPCPGRRRGAVRTPRSTEILNP